MQDLRSEDVNDRLARYYAWKLVIGQIERIFLPDAWQAKRDVERWYGPEAERSGALAPNLLIAIAGYRLHRLETQLEELRNRFIDDFGHARLPAP